MIALSSCKTVGCGRTWPNQECLKWAHFKHEDACNWETVTLEEEVEELEARLVTAKKTLKRKQVKIVIS